MEQPIVLDKQPEIETFSCPKKNCGREFISDQALRMHHIRVHTLAGRQGAMWKRDGLSKKKKTREEILARKRAYNDKRREDFITQGLTSAGKLRKRQFRAGWRKYPVDDKAEERREYKRNWYQKHKKRTPMVVYPIPAESPVGTSQEEITQETKDKVLLSLLIKEYQRSNQ